MVVTVSGAGANSRRAHPADRDDSAARGASRERQGLLSKPPVRPPSDSRQPSRRPLQLVRSLPDPATRGISVNWYFRPWTGSQGKTSERLLYIHGGHPTYYCTDALFVR